MKIHKALKYMSIITVLLSFTLLALVLFWLLYPYKTIEFNGEYKTAKTEYVQGEITTYEVNYCKYTDIRPTVIKKFVDGIEFTSEANRSVLTQGCQKELVELKIPETLPQGKYRLVVYLEYVVNPLRIIKIEHKSNWFVVKQSPDKDIDNFIERS